MAAAAASDAIDIPDTRVTSDGKVVFTTYHVVATVRGETYDVFRRYNA